MSNVIDNVMYHRTEETMNIINNKINKCQMNKYVPGGYAYPGRHGWEG